MTSQQSFYALRDALRTVRDRLPALEAATLGRAAPPANQGWREKLVRNVLPALDFDLPVLLVAICGGGSTGKSTVFNLLAGKPLSKAGFKAGLTTRVLLAGHPTVLAGVGVAQALLYRLRDTPQPWQKAEDTVTPGPPLYATSESMPRTLLLMDTPDFDTGLQGRLLNRERAEPILRTADVILYVFTNTVYNNLSNTRFMADTVGGIGGRPIILVYRISRAASDQEVLEHCAVVARQLYPAQGPGAALPAQVIGLYRMPESDAVALGEAAPHLIPVGDSTRGRSLPELLMQLDVARLKRQALAADLRSIHQGTEEALVVLRRELADVGLYRQALQQALAQQALEALKTFPASEAIGLTTRLFLETSPAYIKLLRGTGRVVSAPLRAAQRLGQTLGRWTGVGGITPPPPNPQAALEHDLLVAANTLRNRLMDDHLIVRVTTRDALFMAAQQVGALFPTAAEPLLEPSGAGTYNVHVRVPQVVQKQQEHLLVQDWEAIVGQLRPVAATLLGLPSDIEGELRALVAEYRARMRWTERLRETFFASLSALPPLLGVTYTLLTANPAAGTGLWIQLQSIFGINDLWALVAIPAAAGLSAQERKQLQQTLTPVFQLWLQRRLATVIEAYTHSICSPILDALQAVPASDDPRLRATTQALETLTEIP